MVRVGPMSEIQMGCEVDTSLVLTGKLTMGTVCEAQSLSEGAKKKGRQTCLLGDAGQLVILGEKLAGILESFMIF